MKISKIYLAVGLLIPSLGLAANGKITNIQFKPEKNRAVLIVNYQGAAKFRMLQSEQNGTVVLEGSNLTLPPSLSKVISAGGVDGPVMQVTPYAAGSKGQAISKIVLQLRKQATASSSEAAGQFMVEIRSKNLSEIASGKKANGRSASETDTLRSRSGATEKGDEVARKLVDVLNAAPEEKEYSGSKVTFEADDASVHDVFRLVGESSGLNIITDTNVKASDSYSLKDVPWDQLLDIVVSKNQLKAKVTGNVVYIITQDQYNKEQDAKLKELTNASAMEPIVMAVIPLSYASASDVKKMIETLLQKDETTTQTAALPNVNAQLGGMGAGGMGAGGMGAGGMGQGGRGGGVGVPGGAGGPGGPGAMGMPNGAAAAAPVLRQDFKRGQIETDERSNSIVVTNTRETIERIRRLVKELDVALPQVLIDTKIVIATDEFTRNVGVQWGGQMQGTGQSGFGAATNTTAVPNSGGFSVSGAAAGIGSNFNFGTSATKKINLALQLGEVNNWTKTLASPRVIVNNKKTAEVNDGESRIVLTQGGVGQAGAVQTVKADLKLQVTPQVTSSGAVLMDVDVQKTAFLRADGQDTTEKSLKTNVLVDSGSTLVLGGVYQYSTTLKESGIPLLKNLPFVGQLFRSNNDTENKSELMVFLSPQILDPNTPNLGTETAATASDTGNL